MLAFARDGKVYVSVRPMKLSVAEADALIIRLSRAATKAEHQFVGAGATPSGILNTSGITAQEPNAGWPPQ